MSHDPHPDDSKAMMHDGCERCEEQSRDPMSHLDDTRLRMLWAMMQAVELRETENYQSACDARAAKQMYRTYVFLERVAYAGWFGELIADIGRPRVTTVATGGRL